MKFLKTFFRDSVSSGILSVSGELVIGIFVSTVEIAQVQNIVDHVIL